MLETAILGLLIAAYAASLALDLKRSKLAAASLILSVSLHGCSLILRSVMTGHAPFSGAFESMTFFSFLLGLKLCFSPRILRRWVIGLVLVFLAGALFLPGHLRMGSPLAPALKSVFFLVHVPVFFLGYVSLAFAFILSLIRIAGKRDDPMIDSQILSEARLGYLLITFGIITGAVWAFLCWGRFWGWDSKETWALVTWLVYSFGLHSRFIRQEHYRLSLILGFLVVLFTYLGVMFLLPGIHSYR